MHDETFDPLTGLLNARGFVLAGAARLRSASDVPAAVAVMTISNQERVREYWGPRAVEEALKTTAKLLRQTFRATDLAARLDAKRFALLVLGWVPASAEEIEKRLAKAARLSSDLSEYAHCIGFEAGIGRRVRVVPCSVETLLLEAEEDRKRRTQGRGGTAPGSFPTH